MFFDLKFKAREELKLIMYSLSPNDEALEVKVQSGRRTEPKLLMYSLSSNDLLREVFIMMKHLKSKCEVLFFVKERVFVKLEPSTKDASSLKISSERTSFRERTKLKEQVYLEGRTSRRTETELGIRFCLNSKDVTYRTEE